MALLSVDGVGVRREGCWTLRGVSFEVQPGEAWGIVGESGAGKTTLVNTVLGLLEPDEGEIRLDGQPWSGLPERCRRPKRSQVQALLQDAPASLPPHLDGWAILEEPLAIHGRGNQAERRARILAVVDQVKLPLGILDQRPGQWSGGLAQRVALARALVLEPRLLVLDEPFASLDATLAQQLLERLLELKAAGLALLVVSHDLAAAGRLCDGLLVLYGGEVQCRGTARALLANPRHPYLRGLVDARADLERSEPPRCWGQLRLRSAGPGACRLYERCTEASALCEVAPPLDLRERCHHLS